jgi:hypothetical protein
VIDGHGRLRNDVRIVDIGDDPNDPLQFQRGIAAASGFQDRIGPEYMPINRVLIWEHALRERFTDDGDGLFAFSV